MEGSVVNMPRSGSTLDERTLIKEGGSGGFREIMGMFREPKGGREDFLAYLVPQRK